MSKLTSTNARKMRINVGVYQTCQLVECQFQIYAKQQREHLKQNVCLLLTCVLLEL